MIQRAKIAVYLSNPLFSFIGGVFLEGLGLCALALAGKNLFLFQLFVFAVAIGGFATALCGVVNRKVGLSVAILRRV